MKPKNITVLCMGCGYQYVTGYLFWKNQHNKCPNCESFKSQRVSEKVNE